MVAWDTGSSQAAGHRAGDTWDPSLPAHGEDGGSLNTTPHALVSHQSVRCVNPGRCIQGRCPQPRRSDGPGAEPDDSSHPRLSDSRSVTRARLVICGLLEPRRPTSCGRACPMVRVRKTSDGYSRNMRRTRTAWEEPRRCGLGWPQESRWPLVPQHEVKSPDDRLVSRSLPAPSWQLAAVEEALATPSGSDSRTAGSC
jgi:hypothetical protein